MEIFGVTNSVKEKLHWMSKTGKGDSIQYYCTRDLDLQYQYVREIKRNSFETKGRRVFKH